MKCVYHDTIRVELLLENAMSPEFHAFENIDQCSAFLDDINKTSPSDIKCLTVCAPWGNRFDRVTLIDTPGYGAAKSDNNCHLSHDDIVIGSLKSDFSLAVMVVQGTHGGLTSEELLFYQRHLQNRVVILAVTGCDPIEEWHEKAKATFYDRFSHKLKIRRDDWHFVSGKSYQNALRCRDSQEIVLSGIPRLVEALRKIGQEVYVFNYLHSIECHVRKKIADFYSFMYTKKGKIRTDALDKYNLKVYHNE